MICTYKILCPCRQFSSSQQELPWSLLFTLLGTEQICCASAETISFFLRVFTVLNLIPHGSIGSPLSCTGGHLPAWQLPKSVSLAKGQRTGKTQFPHDTYTQETISKGSNSWPPELPFQPESSWIAPNDFPWQNNSTSHRQMHQPLSRHLWTVPENLQALPKYEDGPNDAAGSVIQKNEERFLKGDSASFYCSC